MNYQNKGTIEHPGIGDIRKRKELGYKAQNSSSYIFTPCSICDKPRWVQLVKGQPVSLMCLSCAMHQPSYIAIQRAHHRTVILTDEQRARISRATKGKPLSDEHRAKLSRVMQGRQTWLGKHHSKETKGKMSINRKGRKFSSEARRNMSKSSQRQWQDASFIEKMIKAQNHKPNKLELYLAHILDDCLPGHFAYNGDFRLGIALNGQIPDFVNINGKKEVIEVFGDYWHSPKISGSNWKRSELGKAMVYNSLGWKCLILWEHELNKLTEEQIVQKIKAFFKER